MLSERGVEGQSGLARGYDAMFDKCTNIGYTLLYRVTGFKFNRKIYTINLSVVPYKLFDKIDH